MWTVHFGWDIMLDGHTHTHTHTHTQARAHTHAHMNTHTSAMVQFNASTPAASLCNDRSTARISSNLDHSWHIAASHRRGESRHSRNSNITA